MGLNGAETNCSIAHNIVSRAFVKVGIPVSGYFNFCLCYFHTGFALEHPWRLKDSTSTMLVVFFFIFELLEINKLLFYFFAIGSFFFMLKFVYK